MKMVDGWTDRRMDGGGIGILTAHQWAFSSGELKIHVPETF